MNVRRIGLGVVAGVLLFVLVFQLFAQVGEGVDRLETKAEQQELVFKEVEALSTRIQSAKSLSHEKKGEGGIASLLPWLEKETARANFSGHVREIAPLALQSADSGVFREKATLGVAEISMESALRFLQQLEAITEIRVVRGDLKRAEKESGGVTLFLEIGLL